MYASDAMTQKLQTSPADLGRIGGAARRVLNDAKVKGQSSLAFVARDNTAKISAAFIGNGNAMTSLLPIWEGKPLRYDVLKSKISKNADVTMEDNTFG